MTGISDTAAPIRFGTSGWRGIFAEDFTLPRLRAAMEGIARWFAESGGVEVLVAHDTRFFGERLAETAAGVLARHGLRPRLGRGAQPTPVAVRAVLRRHAGGAVVLTASHNAPEYHGLKVFGPGGAGIDDATARRIEAWIPASAAEGEAHRAPRLDLRAPYLRELLGLLDRSVLGRARLQVTYDAMHGAGAGVLDAVLEEAGVRVIRLRGEPDPSFGGQAPDPGPKSLLELRRRLRRARGLSLGLASDGDADRFAAVDRGGRLLSETESLALLVDHLARSGRLDGAVALSIATGSLVERVARAHGLEVRRHRIGFKHLSAALLSGEAQAAGEESGGFALAPFCRDKDGILAGCLLAELVASERAPLGERLRELRRRHGGGVCGRRALAADAPLREALGRLAERPPGRVDGTPVRAVGRLDGLHLALDDGFVMLRASGTEPVLRVYAEAPTAVALGRRLAAGADLLGPSGASGGSR